VAIDKAAVLVQLKLDLQAAQLAMEQAAHTAHDAATHPEAKPENDKDTRGLEAGYLAAGQSARAAELARMVAAVSQLTPRAFRADEPIAVLALVTLEDEDTGDQQRVFLSPMGGGMKLQVDGQQVQVVTPQSPLGDALLGKCAGDEASLRVGPKRRTVQIVNVA
jgi:transcription elongation GreA/GreB family factor